jgi:hypothetical protein
MQNADNATPLIDMVRSTSQLHADFRQMNIPVLPPMSERVEPAVYDRDCFRIIHLDTLMEFIVNHCFCQCGGHWTYEKEDNCLGLSTRLHFCCVSCFHREFWDTSPRIHLKDHSKGMKFTVSIT